MSLLRAVGNVLLYPFRKVAAAAALVGERLYWVVLWLYHLRVEVWSVEGVEQHSGQPLSLLCGLRGETKNYILQLIYGDQYRQRSLGRYWLWNLSKAIPAADGDPAMILNWSCLMYFRFVRADDWFFIPDWVYGEVALPRDAEALRKVNGDLRRIRSHGLTYEITRDPQKFDDFYYNMHIPYISKTFGKCAYLLPYKVLKDEFEKSDLILIKSGEQAIAGQLIWHCDDGPFLESMGIRDGDKEHLKNGASCALYHYAMEYLHQQGSPKAIVGWSRPFLHNGVLNFKRKWSQVITFSRPWGYGMRVLSPTAAVKSFLRNNPFIFNRGGLLYAAVFVAADKPLSTDDIEQITRDYFHAGLEGVALHRLRPEDDAASSPPAVELPEHIAMCEWPR
jgi:hypothetical protein